MRNRKPWLWIALSIACWAGTAGAGEMADSTGKVRAKKALQIPAGLSLDDVLSAVKPLINDPSEVPALPVGYEEVTFSAGPHAGASPSYSDVSYGYSRPSQFGVDSEGNLVAPTMDASLCLGDLTHRIIEVIVVPPPIYGSVPAAVYGLYTCEPYGTVTKLVKKGAPSATKTLIQSDVSAYALAGTIGVNTSGARPICQALGYTDFIPGTITSWYKGGGCPGGYITQYNGSAWLSNTACYNNVLTGLQCYK